MTLPSTGIHFMSITLEQVASTLNELKCRTNFNIKNVTEYMLPELKEPVYLHVEGKTPLLIIRPAFEVFSTELATIDGVHAKYDYYHNAQMTRFPTRRNKGLSEIHYGLAFRFDTTDAIILFINRLIEIVKG
ncbi:MAG: hypothetical protein COW76_01305 [Shewanella sp. CG18_big_fil_WC_8_21_14_2_50_42_11]|jgi:hypothetical protein|nr:MAG: hypothetical protein COW76_01305 [Shewanella sp. CG18_big_fil_WC_8_21_14_2_50_42_11]PIX73071.1 MAG: hypothetical protein COZ42_03255 [Shewanella sp. CG_4_10_14_3_um_filter_42_91]PIY63763.1 MAG: hypothetical protein COY92_19735 [Shewanella sp. CG_4_10_14_0_8_um_filter_42_13]PJB92562.1 MAG: hypothetical protein CO084_05895 [Shewanella sp. CG_4_9_14_0_8_um_filter_42_14]RPA55102.1 hypothetical protein EGC79_07970 [Shewanella vesiculosa]|tara:strand:- start:936 stop:1331 length:396 start_codon:yes stop_codon:yes gene_type:complete